MKKTLQVANGFSLIFTIIFNYLSNTGIFNGKTIGNVSDQYHTLITPAGYAFSIWGLIYLLLLGFVFYTGRSLFNTAKNEADDFEKNIGWWFVISCIANCAWIVAWLYGFSGISVLILGVAMVSLTKILLEALKYNNSTAEKGFINIPFQIYAGWMSVALIVATASWLHKIGWNGWGISESTWTIIMIAVASVIHLMMTWQKNAPFFAFVGAWAFIAISQSNEAGSAVSIFAIIAATVLFISSCTNLYKRSVL